MVGSIILFTFVPQIDQLTKIMRTNRFFKNSARAVAAFLFATVMSMGFTACSDNNDNPAPIANATPSISELAGQWLADYAKTGIDSVTGKSWNRIVEVYCFTAYGRGYYESYFLDGQKLVVAEWTRDNCEFSYTINGNTLSITDDMGDSWNLVYSVPASMQPQFTNEEGVVITKAFGWQMTLIDGLYDAWKAGN